MLLDVQVKNRFQFEQKSIRITVADTNWNSDVNVVVDNN